LAAAALIGPTLIQIRNEAACQIVVARNTLTTSISAYSAATALASAAQTSFNAAHAACRNGVRSISDATTAERQLLAAKNTATDAYSAAYPLQQHSLSQQASWDLYPISSMTGAPPREYRSGGCSVQIDETLLLAKFVQK
jgi:hypothetical protein